MHEAVWALSTAACGAPCQSGVAQHPLPTARECNSAIHHVLHHAPCHNPAPHRCSTPLLHTAAPHHAHHCCTPCTPLLPTTRDAVHQAALLRLKREMASYEQACRVWEVCWAAGGDFHLKVLAGLVLSQQAWARGAHSTTPSREYPSSSIPVELYLVSEHYR